MTAHRPTAPIVRVEWRDGDPDSWQFFRLVGTMPHGWLMLQGVEDMIDGTKHAGDTGLYHRDEIRSVTLWEPTADEIAAELGATEAPEKGK